MKQKKLKKSDIVVVSKEKAFWLKVKEINEQKKEVLDNELKLLNAVLDMTNDKLKRCKD